jgi:hypothetical protein
VIRQGRYVMLVDKSNVTWLVSEDCINQFESAKTNAERLQLATEVIDKDGHILKHRIANYR